MKVIHTYQCDICKHNYDNEFLAKLCESIYIMNKIKNFPNPIDKDGNIRFNTRYDGTQIDKVCNIYTYPNKEFQESLSYIYSKNKNVIEIMDIIKKEALEFNTLHELYYEVEGNHELIKDNLTNEIPYSFISIPNLYQQQLLHFYIY